MVPFLPALIQMAKWLFPGMKLEQSGPFLELAAKYGQPADHALPSEILSLGLKMFGRGLYTQLAWQTRTHWKWPYWLMRQGNPADPQFQAVAHLIICQNRVFRNWTLLGLPNHTERLVVDPAMMMTPLRDGFSIEFWLQEGDHLVPLFDGPPDPDSYISNRFPLIRRQMTTPKGIGIRQNVFVSTVAGFDFGFTRLKIRNTTNRMQTVKLWMSIRPYNPEGISPVYDVRYEEGRRLWWVNSQPAVVTADTPTVVLSGSDKAGDVWNMPLKKRPVMKDSCQMGLATAASVYHLNILAGDIENLDFAFPLSVSDGLQALDWEDPDFFNYSRAKNRFYYRWNREWDHALSISIPDEQLQPVTTSAIGYQSLFVQGSALIPGYLIYQDFWFRDAAFLGMVLLKSGQSAPVKALLLAAPARQKPDGFFESQEGEWDSNGQLLWLAGQYWRYTRDAEPIRHLWNELVQGARWIQKKRIQGGPDHDIRGLLPAGFSAEHFGANDFYYWDNFWSLAGLDSLSMLADQVGQSSQLQWLEREREEYRTTLIRSVQLVARDGNGAVPASPKRQPDAGSIGIVAALYPLQLVDFTDPFMTETCRFLIKRFMTNGRFFHPVAHTGVNVYLSLHLLRYYLYQRDPVIWSHLRSLAETATPTYTWPEAFHPTLGGGVMGEGHHGWANAEWVSMVRDCLVCDWQDELWLTPVLDPDWFDRSEGEVEIKNTGTPFGKVSCRVEWTETAIYMKWSCEFHQTPSVIRWFLPDRVRQQLTDSEPFPADGLRIGEPSGSLNLRRQIP